MSSYSFGPHDRAITGENNAICQVCGQKYKATQLRKRWDGFWVCRHDWHPRQAQDFVRGVKESAVPLIRAPEQADVFVNNYCYPESSFSIFGDAALGCWVIGKPIT